MPCGPVVLSPDWSGASRCAATRQNAAAGPVIVEPAPGAPNRQVSLPSPEDHAGFCPFRSDQIVYDLVHAAAELAVTQALASHAGQHRLLALRQMEHDVGDRPPGRRGR